MNESVYGNGVSSNVGTVKGSVMKKRRRTKRKMPLTFKQMAGELKVVVSNSTYKNYKTAFRSLRKFCGGRDICLNELTPKMARMYEIYLREDGICKNTSGAYLRSLQALYNAAVTIGLVTDCKPFRQVFTGTDKAVKRATKDMWMQAIILLPCYAAHA